jgi:ankyrin repeat protein
MAIEQRRLDLVQILLIAGADINDPTAKLRGRSALALAIKEDDADMVNFLLANAADPDDSGALASAVSENDAEMTTQLLNARFWQHPTCRRGFGCKALHIAIMRRYTELADLLLSWGIDPNVRYRGRTALGIAIRNIKWKISQLDMVKTLLKARANPNITVETWDHRGKNFRDRTALLSAISCEHMALIELLLEFGANVNEPARGRILRTPLQAACEKANLEAIRLLLNHGAEINAPPARQRGATALQFAAISGHIGIAALLLQRGADVNAPAAKIDGRTALEGAAEHGHIDMAKLLLNAGAMINGPGEKQYARALKFAKKNGHTPIRKMLEEFALQYAEGR